MMATISSTVDTKQNFLNFSYFFLINNKLLITVLSADKSVIFEVTLDAADADTIISYVGAYLSCFYI